MPGFVSCIVWSHEDKRTQKNPRDHVFWQEQLISVKSNRRCCCFAYWTPSYHHSSSAIYPASWSCLGCLLCWWSDFQSYHLWSWWGWLRPSNQCIRCLQTETRCSARTESSFCPWKCQMRRGQILQSARREIDLQSPQQATLWHDCQSFPLTPWGSCHGSPCLYCHWENHPRIMSCQTHCHSTARRGDLLTSIGWNGGVGLVGWVGGGLAGWSWISDSSIRSVRQRWGWGPSLHQEGGEGKSLPSRGLVGTSEIVWKMSSGPPFLDVD